MSVAELLKPARGAAESMGAYRERRQAGNAYVKRRLRGRVLWDSRNGTYRIEDHGILT